MISISDELYCAFPAPAQQRLCHNALHNQLRQQNVNSFLSLLAYPNKTINMKNDCPIDTFSKIAWWICGRDLLFMRSPNFYLDVAVLKKRIVTSCSWSHKPQASPECTLSTIDSVKIFQKHFLKSNLRWIPIVLRNCLALCKHDVFASINGDNMIDKLLLVYSTYYNVEIRQRLPTKSLIYYSSVQYQVHFIRTKKILKLSR